MKRNDRSLADKDPEIILCHSPSKKEIKQITSAVENYNRLQTQGEYDEPGIEIIIALKDEGGNTIGGVIASTVFRIMHLEVLWVSNSNRRRGYGSQLVIAAENIGYSKGCITAQTWTFSFQGPDFYPSIGYQPIGIYEGYPDKITEHVFMKRLPESQIPVRSLETPDASGYFLTTSVGDEDIKILHNGLHQHSIQHIGDGYKGIAIHLTASTISGKLVGGLHAWTTLKNLIFEHIWIEEDFRGRGIGRMLMSEMEKIARKQGCIASQAHSFSFQAPGFFEKCGYKLIGLSDGYPQSVTEHYLMKKYSW